MSSFTAVVAGNPTLATDINQLINYLNGTTGGQVTTVSGNNSSSAIIASLPSAPASDQDVVRANIVGDTTARSALYIRSADGYGGLEAGNNAGITATWYGTSSGWKTDQSVNITSGLTVGGTLAVTGTVTFGGHGVMLFGSGTSNPRVFTGTSTPVGASEGDIWCKG